MITKFETVSEDSSIIEFAKEHGYLMIYAKHPLKEQINIILEEEDLFNLIGQLLRIQSELRKESTNG